MATLSPVAFADLPGWRMDDHRHALDAFRRSCDRVRTSPGNQQVRTALVNNSGDDWGRACNQASGVQADDPAAARQFFMEWFAPHRVDFGDSPEGRFTGYYEPELRGARVRHGNYSHPLYRRPADLVSADLGRFDESLQGRSLSGRVVDGRLVPYHSRAEIEAGALSGKGLELLWVDDPIDAFFLHVQGSGRVILENGEVVRVGFAGKNGRPYVALGRELARRGAIAEEQISMQTIRAWLAGHPDQANAVMALNPSYVFFRLIEGNAAIGAHQVELTPERSLAVDPEFVPLGTPIWLDTTDPLDAERPLRRLVVAQDTGSAIKGPIRGDLFFGHGRAAEEKAGRMNRKGRYYLLLPKRSGGG
jgi:membrane-bound lytic murein transglycosylase A